MTDEETVGDWSPYQVIEQLRILRCPDYLVYYLEHHVDVCPQDTSSIFNWIPFVERFTRSYVLCLELPLL
jgi:hypothetical protein